MDSRSTLPSSRQAVLIAGSAAVARVVAGRRLADLMESRARMKLASRTALRAVAFGLTATDLYLVGLLALAARHRPARATRAPGAEPLRFVVLVPAHDEEAMIAGTVAALCGGDYPPDRRRIVVVADNCSDATAELAAAAGATVLERSDPERRGKGHALNWALDRLPEIGADADAIALVDADCEPSPNLLAALDDALRGGASAAQAGYTVSNPGASTQSSLRYAAFALMNTVRPMGKTRAGLSSGLLGTGMAFRRTLLERHRFAADSLVEDADLHLRLVAAGERVVFVPGAAVRSPMPTSARASRAQQSRWEGGRADLLRRWTAPLLLGGARRRDRVRLHAWLELLVPPQTILGLAHVTFGAFAALSGWRAARRVALLDGGLQMAFILGGLRLVRAPASVYRALGAAPLLAVQKVGLFGRLLVRGAPRTWERTAREGAPPPP
jgi:glycosyltransferase involved in cell wall biosynthesis